MLSRLLKWGLVPIFFLKNNTQAYLTLCSGSVFNSENVPALVQTFVSHICARTTSEKFSW